MGFFRFLTSSDDIVSQESKMKTANESLNALLDSVIDSITPPNLSETNLNSLILLIGSNMLVNALDLIDNKEGKLMESTWYECGTEQTMKAVVRLNLPNDRTIYQVSGSSMPYTVTIPPDASHNSAIKYYCPCPAFSFSVLASDTNVIVQFNFRSSPH